MRRRSIVLVLALMMALALLPATASAAPGGKSNSNVCDNRTNNTIRKLLECVTIDGVREHQAAFQAIADANGGIRTSGTPGYDASARLCSRTDGSRRLRRDDSAV